jgi:hypothetical protein
LSHPQQEMQFLEFHLYQPAFSLLPAMASIWHCIKFS